MDLQVYSDFEKPFLVQTQGFFHEEGARLIQEVPPAFICLSFALV